MSFHTPKYRLHKGSGQAFVQIKGHRHYLGRWDSRQSKERYAAFVAELAVRPAIPMPPTVDSLNVGAAAAVFLYEIARQRKKA